MHHTLTPEALAALCCGALATPYLIHTARLWRAKRRKTWHSKVSFPRPHDHYKRSRRQELGEAYRDGSVVVTALLSLAAGCVGLLAVWSMATLMLGVGR